MSTFELSWTIENRNCFFKTFKYSWSCYSFAPILSKALVAYIVLNLPLHNVQQIHTVVYQRIIVFLLFFKSHFTPSTYTKLSITEHCRTQMLWPRLLFQRPLKAEKEAAAAFIGGRGRKKGRRRSQVGECTNFKTIFYYQLQNNSNRTRQYIKKKEVSIRKYKVKQKKTATFLYSVEKFTLNLLCSIL